MSQVQQEMDIKIINERLKQLNEEFQELSALKKEYQTNENNKKLLEKFSHFKFMIKSPTLVEEINFDHLLANANLVAGTNHFGLPLISYNIGNGPTLYPIVESKDEVLVRVKVDKLLTLADEVKADFEKNKQTNDPNKILALFQRVLDE